MPVRARIISYTFTIAFLYLSIIAFAYRVYPFIPVERGGGDFSRFPISVAVLSFRPDHIEAFPKSLIDSRVPEGNMSVPVIVLNESDTVVYLATARTLKAIDVERVLTKDKVALRKTLEGWRDLSVLAKPQEIFAVNKVDILFQTVVRLEN